MTALRLLLPHELKPRMSVTATDRAFRFGPRIAPNRAPYEFYPTPPAATRALLSAESFDGSIWEPACGQGHISKVLVATGHQVVSTDLVAYGYGEAGRDFLAEPEPLAKHIVTNPPYGRGLADAFVKHALNLTKATGGKVAMLLTMNSLCHPLRHDLFTESSPTAVYCLDKCECWPAGNAGRATASLTAQRYCWMVWEH
ncbi:MAG: hypothetical protein HC869_18695, partial [Rhodospirillales bacterium]|nr:hypothetical protein [Rhodospirillales bacterium]